MRCAVAISDVTDHQRHANSMQISIQRILPVHLAWQLLALHQLTFRSSDVAAAVRSGRLSNAAVERARANSTSLLNSVERTDIYSVRLVRLSLQQLRIRSSHPFFGTLALWLFLAILFGSIGKVAGVAAVPKNVRSDVRSVEKWPRLADYAHLPKQMRKETFYAARNLAYKDATGTSLRQAAVRAHGIANAETINRVYNNRAQPQHNDKLRQIKRRSAASSSSDRALKRRARFAQTLLAGTHSSPNWECVQKHDAIISTC